MEPLRAFQTTQRNLPHWQDPGAVYFLTWCTSSGFELTADEKTLVLNAVRHWDGTRWKLYLAVVMPDHIHALARLLGKSGDDPMAQEFWNLTEVTKSVKGYSARMINVGRKRSGMFWQDESYDRIVRDDREFESYWQYIRNNPVEAGLVETPEQYEWLYEFQEHE